MGTEAQRVNVPRVVLDTNVLVSALVFGGGHWQWLRQAWQGDRFVPLVSRATASELLRVLAYPKFKLSESEQEHLLADYLPYAEAVEVPDDLAGVPEVRDRDDAPFLHLALAGDADVLVSGDGDLTVLRGVQQGVRIMAPAEFRRWLESER